MRAGFSRSALPLGSLVAASLAALLIVLALPTAMPGALHAEPAAPAGQAGAAKGGPKQIALTQQKIDSLITVQKKVDDLESKSQAKGANAEQPEGKMQKEVEGIITANGFSSVQDFADTNYSVGMVISGLDPDSNDYIGTAAALQKEAAQVKADKKMPANEKKEVLDEINAAMKAASTEKALPGNIDIVKSNLAKLDQGSKEQK